MKKLIEIKKKIANDWFKSLQNKIINQFQILENEAGKKIERKLKFLLKENGRKIIKKKVVALLIFYVVENYLIKLG